MQWDLLSPNPVLSATGHEATVAHQPLELGKTTTVPVQGGQFQVTFTRLVDGNSDGVAILSIDTGRLRTAIVPTRGMGLWKAWSPSGELGWKSPVAGPIHPKFVPIFDPNGIGWLEGFDELVVRCGLQSNGAPDFAENGMLRFPLHGRIANLPATTLSIVVDPEAGTLDVLGNVVESRFHIQALSLDVRYRFHVNRSTIDCQDTVVNQRSQAATMQMLYHINLGRPLLEAGARVVTAIDELAPRNAWAATEIDRWDSYRAPTAGYAEQVYFARPSTDQRGWTTCVLHDASQKRGVAVRFDTHTLPFLNLWKNEVAVEDGYVTGIEPATGFPNPRSFEEKQGRLVQLAGGQKTIFTWQLESLDDREAVERAVQEVRSLQKSPPKVHREPKSEWSDGV